MTADRKEPPRLRGVWRNMIQRCHNPNHHQYCSYGGRGITVCDEWRNDYSCFREWALKNGYAQGLTIDRIDNNGGYSPQNCRWATYKEQNRNKRSNRNITLNGETKCLSEWAEFFGIGVPLATRRLNDGWAEEDAFTAPLYARKTTQKDTLKTMHERIRGVAAAKGLSIHKLEQLANVANGTICRLLDGRSIRVKTFINIVRVLGVSADYLVGITDEQ